jgi:hypothetical protein
VLTAAPDLDFGLAERLLDKFAGPLTGLFIVAGIFVAIRILSNSLGRLGEEIAPATPDKPAVRITIGGTLQRIAAVAVIVLIAVVVLNNGLDVFKAIVGFAYSLADTPAVSPSPAP